MEEIWRDIKDYETLYQVSDLGRVKSMERLRIGNHGALTKVHEKIMTFKIDKNGYHCLSLSKDNKTKMKRVSRLVAEAFIPNPENKPEVNHKDCNKSNNNVNNLEWVSKIENEEHAKNNGKKKFKGNQYL